MPEPLTTQLVVELLQKLLAAFPRNLGAQNPQMMADVYRNGLRGMDGDAVRAAVDVAIQSDNYFPKVARLRELASEWTKRNRVNVGPRPGDEGVCHICRQRPQPRERWRPKVDDRHNLVIRGEYLLLEPFVRDLCDCAPPCWYAPIDADAKEPMMKGEDIQREYRAWLTRRSEHSRTVPEAAD